MGRFIMVVMESMIIILRLSSVDCRLKGGISVNYLFEGIRIPK